MPFCPICGKDVTEQIKEKDTFPIMDLWYLVCDWCRENVICYGTENIQRI
jgi:hypothetical protein